MICQSCNAELPAGKVLCPKCKHLNLYEIKGFSNTKAVQAELKALVAEQSDNISNTRELIAIMYDYLPDYDAERKLLRKALEGDCLNMILKGLNKKTAFSSVRSHLMHEMRFTREKAEFVLACLGHMLGLAYVSTMIVEEKAPEPETKEENKSRPLTPDLKPYGKLDAVIHRLSRRITVKEGFTRIDPYCFENFGMLREITLPDTLLMVGEYAFTDCRRLEEVTIPDSVRKVEKGAFNACVGLKKVILPQGLGAIGDNTFLCCTSLEVLRVPDNVSSIGENAFSGCSSLKKLIIPKNVKFVDSNAFAYCKEVTVICSENSFIHKYCMQNEIKFKTLPMGAPLPTGYEGEESPDD